MPRADEHEFLLDVLGGNEWAVDLCETLFFVSQVLDDLVDGDPVEQRDIELAFWSLLVKLPQNAFYRQHTDTLVPMLQVFLQDWFDATALERSGDKHDQHLAFVLRDTLGGLVIQVAGILGGFDYAREVGPAVRRHIHEDTLKEYKRGIRHERRRRRQS